MAFTGKKISGQYFCSKKVPSPDRDNADGGHTCPRRRSIPAPAPRLRRSSAWGRGLASRPVRLRHAVAAESWSGPTRPVSWPQWEPTGRGRRSSLGGPAPPPPHPPPSVGKPAAAPTRRGPGARRCTAASAASSRLWRCVDPTPRGCGGEPAATGGPCTPTAAGMALPRRGPLALGQGSTLTR